MYFSLTFYLKLSNCHLLKIVSGTVRLILGLRAAITVLPEINDDIRQRSVAISRTILGQDPRPGYVNVGYGPDRIQKRYR